MTRFHRALPIAALFLLAACTTSTDVSPSAQPTDPPEPTATGTTEATGSPAASGSPDATESPEGTPVEGGGGFTYEANAEADALMEESFSCENLDDGYQVDFPAEWNANAEIGGVPPCSWFAPTEYETGAPGDVPDEVAIEILVIDGSYSPDGEPSERADGFVGATQPATRIRFESAGVEHYEYVVQLGPTLEEGPNLVARTTSEMGEDFELNRAILDRMMATMEFIGVIQ
jgi:hypothetical protein